MPKSAKFGQVPADLARNLRHGPDPDELDQTLVERGLIGRKDVSDA